MAKKKHKVQINYKSGNSMVLVCRDFHVSIKNGAKNFTWTPVNSNKTVMWMNLDEVESVWQLK